MQWGYYTNNNWGTHNSNFYVKFPITFPHQCFTVNVTSDRITSGDRGYNHVNRITKEGCFIVIEQKDYIINGLNVAFIETGVGTAYWFAIGY